MAFNVVYKQSVSRDLKKLSKTEARQLLGRIETELPHRAHKVPLLKGKFKGLRKYRCGAYRVIFTIRDGEIVVLRIGHRKDVYRQGV